MKIPLLFLFVLLSCLPVKSQERFNFSIVNHWESLDAEGEKPKNNIYNEIWGFEQYGREYAVIGDAYGAHFVDVTDSISLREVAMVDGAFQGKAVIHRDFKKYKNYIYAVCDEGKGKSTLQIIDTKYLPKKARVVYDSKSLFSTSHNLFVDTSSQTLYSCTSSGLLLYSLVDPEDPQFVGDYKANYVHDLYVRNDTAFLNCGKAGLHIVDFTNKSDPKEIFALKNYKDKGYNHCGWLSNKGSVYVFADETLETRVKICDVSDLSNIEIVSFIPLPGDSSIPHNVLINKNWMYISYYLHGVLVYDISDIENPRKVAELSLETRLNPYFEGVWGVYPFLPSGNILISDRIHGLYVLGHGAENPISIKETLEKKKYPIEFSPNPIKDYLKVKFKTLSNENCDLRLFDLQGKEMAILYQGNSTNKEIEISLINREVQKGMYVIQGNIGNEKVYKKIVVAY